MPLGLYPCDAGVSELWRSPEPGGAVLALGNAWNAAAAATGELLGCKVSHIIAVGSHRNFTAISALLTKHGQHEIDHKFFRMSDWLRPDEQLDLRVELSEALQALQSAVQPKSTAENRLVLLHCDQGHNRSPTLALTFFLHNGHTLRQAYGRLLEVRPDVDPLPPYRRGLCALEAELYWSLRKPRAYQPAPGCLRHSRPKRVHLCLSLATHGAA